MTDFDHGTALREYVLAYRDRFASYHHQKESMAYTAFALYLAAAGSTLLANSRTNAAIELAAITAAWFAALWFIGWQLIRRRLAAVRVAGAEALLAKWLRQAPTDDDAQRWADRKAGGGNGALARWWHFLWPAARPMPEPDTSDDDLPAALVAACRRQDYWKSTQALAHEKGLYIIGYCVWLAAATRCLVRLL
jgi:hypothetical protein